MYDILLGFLLVKHKSTEVQESSKTKEEVKEIML